jgi:hypothetical protein
MKEELDPIPINDNFLNAQQCLKFRKLGFCKGFCENVCNLIICSTIDRFEEVKKLHDEVHV